MKIGSEDRKKLILAGSLGVLALGTILYEFAGGSDAPAPASAPPPVLRSNGTAASPVTARVSRSALDPTLHPEGMLAAEAVVYTGSGRNIFSGILEQTARVDIPKPIAPARVNTPPPAAYTGPQAPPPIDLRFFGTAQRQGGKRQAFFLRGDDVFLAGEGEIVSRRYRVGTIAATSVQVTDLTNNSTQTLPLLAQ